MTIDPKEHPTAKNYGYLVGAIGPRPIAFASTVDAQGNPNLSPYSFFNVFSANPPVVIFSPVRRVQDNSVKDTLKNIEETGEVVINIVNYAMVQQMSLSSASYDRGVDEFVKSGFTKVPSETVKPFRVKESPASFECRLREIVSLGEEGGAGNLVICEVTRMHFSEDILQDGKIDQRKIDQVARMGGNWYTRAAPGMFEVPKPTQDIGVGVDQIPENIKHSQILTGNDLGKLGTAPTLPNEDAIEAFMAANSELYKLVSAMDENRLHRKAQELLHDDKVAEAWKLLLAKK